MEYLIQCIFISSSITDSKDNHQNWKQNYAPLKKQANPSDLGEI